MKARCWLPTLGWLLLTLVCAQSVQAGPLWDLLFGRRNDRYYPGQVNYPQGAVTAYYPVTVYYPVTTYPSTTVQYPATSYTANYPGSNVVIAGYPAVAQATTQQPLTVNYGSPYQITTAPMDAGAPTTVQYGSIIGATEPTTTYYPSTATCAGGVCATTPSATTTMMPATGNASFVPAFPQAAPYRTVWYRVPVTSFRPVTSVDPTTGAAVTALQPCTTYTWQARRVPHTTRFPLLSRLFGRDRRPTTPALVYPYTAACIAPGTTTAPLAAGTALGACPPGTAILAPTSPSGISGNAPAGVGTSLDPADMRPSLQSPPATPPSNGGAATSERGLTLPLSGATSVAPPSTGSATSNDSAATSPTRNSATQTQDNNSLFDLRPVPDPDAILNSRKRFEPPRLLDPEPRDRSASLDQPPAGAFVLVAWPARSEPAAAAPQAAAPKAANDSGWRPVP